MDKKYTGLNPAGPITANDIIAIVQNLSTSEVLQTTAGDLQSFFFNGASSGARIYFPTGAPPPGVGVDGDVAFDVAGLKIYAKEGGAWVFKANFGSSGGVGVIRFTAVYGSDGLSLDGLTYQNDDLVGNIVTSVSVEVTPLIPVEEFGTPPAFDEFDFDTDTGEIKAGAPILPGTRITVQYTS